MLSDGRRDLAPGAAGFACSAVVGALDAGKAAWVSDLD
jgi:hypothetical protein